MKKLCLLLLILPAYSKAQPGISIQAHWNGIPLESGRYYPLSSAGDSIRMDVLRFYLGVLPSGEAAQTEHHLVDMSVPESMHFALGSTAENPHPKLLLGVDSMTQMDGAGGGALDPTQGMYWTWQSGYIHLKLEGSMRRTDGTQMPFSYHIGGFEGKDNTLQSISADSSGILKPNLAALFRQITPESNRDIMSPGAKAVSVSRAWKDCFSAEP